MRHRGKSPRRQPSTSPRRAAALARVAFPRRKSRFGARAHAHSGGSLFVVSATPPSPASELPSNLDGPWLSAPREERIRILCVEDNLGVADAIRIRLQREDDLVWRGNLATAHGLLEAVERERPAVVLLDLDMPGPDPIALLPELARRFPATRALIFSGHVRSDLVERAIEAGAWGYVSKNDGESALPSFLRRVAKGEFVLSPEVRAVWGG